jgi:hypothetical protein
MLGLLAQVIAPYLAPFLIRRSGLPTRAELKRVLATFPFFIA